MHELKWTETRPPVFNLPISALQNNCCGWAGWQLHPSTTSSMPAPSKRSTQSTRHALRSWDMAMMTLTTPPLDKHSGTTSDSVAQQSESGRQSAAWGWMRGWSSEMSSAELKGRCGKKRFHKFKVHLRIQAAVNNFWVGRMASLSLSLPSTSLLPSPLCRQHTEKLTIVGSNHTLVLNAERVAHREPLMYSTI